MMRTGVGLRYWFPNLKHFVIIYDQKQFIIPPVAILREHTDIVENWKYSTNSLQCKRYVYLKDRYGEPERGEWMGADKNSSQRRWRLQQDEHSFQHTSPTHYPSWPSPRSHWSATEHRNQLPTSQTRERSGTPNLESTDQYRSDRSLLVKLGDFHRMAPHRSGRCNTPVRPVSARKPQNTKQAYRAPNWPKLETAATQDNSKHTQMFTRAKTQQGLHRSDRWEAPVRPVWPGLLRMNNTRGSTPRNPSLDLPNHSTDLNKTLGIVGTPHEESIAKINPTKTCPNNRNWANTAKNTSKPRTPKTPKSSPLTHGFGRGITAQRTTKGSHKFPPSNPKSKVPKTHWENHKERAPKTTTKNNREQLIQTLRNHPNHLYIPQRFIQGLACRPIIQPSQQDLTMKLSS
jgi:hypothetical protein